MLTIRHLTLGYPGHPPVLENFSLHIAPGERVGLVGPSGSGKTLLARAIVGLLPARAQVRSGELEWEAGDNATDLLRLSNKQRRLHRSRNLGYINQEPLTALNPVHRCGKQLEEAARYLRPDLKTPTERAACLGDWLARVGLATDAERVLNAYPHELSGGQRQRLVLILALLGRPRLILADEPTTALDSIREAEVLRLLVRLCEETSTALLYITHDERTLRRVAQRVVELGAERAAAEHVVPVRPPIAESKGVLTVTNLSVAYGQGATAVGAVRDVSFGVAAGEFVALVGASGCGKTTLARALVGLVPTAPNTDYPRETNPMLQARIQLIFQDPYASLHPTHSIATILGEVLRVHRPVLNRRERRTAAAELLAQVSLAAALLGRRAEELSGGQRQRVAIARALAANPEVLICDEAVSALDAPVRLEILNLLQQLRREQGLAILFITHDLYLVRDYADRVLVMDAGQIVERAAPSALFSEPLAPASRALVAAAAGKF